jgi:hypothetical protein
MANLQVINYHCVFDEILNVAEVLMIHGEKWQTLKLSMKSRG